MWVLLALFTWTSAVAQDCISGTVFEDVNDNGAQDVGENGILGLTVVAIAPDGTVLTTLTNMAGFYEFCMLIPGAYYVYPQLATPNLVATPPHYNPTYLPGISLPGNNFAIANLDQLGTIVGKAYFDANDNGVQDAFEPDLVQVEVTLNGPVGTRMTLTDPNGRFRFGRLPTGDYTVTIADIALPNTNWNMATTIGVFLEVGQTSNEIRWGRRPNPGFGAVIGVVCYDLNADGVNDPATEPGIYDRTSVQLLNNQGQLVANALIDGSGRYVLAGFNPGVYRVQGIYDPEEFNPTTPTDYTVDLAPGFRVPGPFYYEPRRKLFRCGMAVSTFGSAASNSLVMSVKDIRDRTGAPVGVAMDWNTVTNINQPKWNITDMGEVFGIATDEDFNAYVAATSMPGYVAFNSVAAGDPLIYFINAFTGLPVGITSAVAGTTTVGNNTVNTQVAGGTFKGFGNICSNHNGLLYASNIAEGTILAINDGATGSPGDVMQIYTPANVTAASLVPHHLWGIGYSRFDQRVYYATPPTAGVVRIYSLNAAGGILSGPEQLEVSINTGLPVADIAFAQDGNRMLIAERGEGFNAPHNARVFQYQGGSGSWTAPQQLFVGGYSVGQNSAGGVDYVHESFQGDMPVEDFCEPFVAASGNALVLSGTGVYGYAIFPAAGNSLAFANDFVGLNSIFIDNDVDIMQWDKGYQGDVEIFDCACPPTDCALELGLEMLPNSPANSTPEECCVSLDFTNTGPEAIHAIDFAGLNGVELANVVWGAGFSRPNYGPSHATLVPTAGGAFPANAQNLIEFCVHNRLATPQFVVISYLNADLDTICRDTLTIDCPPERACLYIAADSLVCDSNGYKYIATITNPTGSDFPVGYVKFNIDAPFSSVVTFTSADFGGTPLQPGQSAMVMFTIPTNVDYFGQDLCFVLSAHDDERERLCCAEIDTCIAFPLCDPCPFVDAELEPNASIQSQGDSCCYTLLITNEFLNDPSYFTGVQVMVLDPADMFSTVQTFPAPPGWTLPSVDIPNQMYTWNHPSGSIPLVDNLPLFSFCMEPVYRTDSIYIKVNWLSADSVVCSDTLAVFCPACLTIETDSLWCTPNSDGTPGGGYTYAFQFTNHSPYVVNAVGLSNTNGAYNVSPAVQLINPVAPGGTSGWIPIDIDGPPGEFCFDIILRQITDSVNILCCYAEHCLTLPDCGELEPLRCPDPNLVSSDPCPLNWLPVCGCDGLTYSNPCFALNAGVFLWTYGECDNGVASSAILLQAELNAPDAGVRLLWDTPNDGNYVFFVVQRLLSNGGEVVLGYVPALPGITLYDFVDLAAPTGSNTYRIVGVDSGGQPTYSNEATVQVLAQSPQLTLAAYPVPANQLVHLATNRVGAAEVELLTPDGRMLRQENHYFGAAPVPIDLRNLQPGVIVVRLRFANGETAQQRVVKLN